MDSPELATDQDYRDEDIPEEWQDFIALAHSEYSPPMATCLTSALTLVGRSLSRCPKYANSQPARANPAALHCERSTPVGLAPIAHLLSISPCLHGPCNRFVGSNPRNLHEGYICGGICLTFTVCAIRLYAYDLALFWEEFYVLRSA